MYESVTSIPSGVMMLCYRKIGEWGGRGTVKNPGASQGCALHGANGTTLSPLVSYFPDTIICSIFCV
jgi:hypothetical protein